MTTIPRRRIPGTGLNRIALLYRAIDETWRYRFRDRNVPVSTERAVRILALAAAVPGAHVDPADVDTARDDALHASARKVIDRHDRVLRALADERDSLDDDGTPA